MRGMLKTTLPLAALALAALAAPVALAQTGPENVVMNFTELAPLDEAVEGHYEGWAIVDGMPISTGVFNVSDTGTPIGLNGGDPIPEFDAGQDITDATDIKITIEPADDADPAPSGLVILAGPVDNLVADMATAVPGLDVLENQTQGTFILATPSDNPDMPDNDDHGIWFLQQPGPAPGLENLPDIGPDWIYEGWVVDTSGENPVPYSTGTFSMAEGADSDEAGPMGGGPPFPGQDFVEFQGGPVLDLDTGDFSAVITIEPMMDNAPAPFQLKPLRTPIPTDALGQNNDMVNDVIASFPAGVALLHGNVATEATDWGTVKSLFR